MRWLVRDVRRPLGLLALALAGCLASQPTQLPVSRDTPLACNGQVSSSTLVARAQHADTEQPRTPLVAQLPDSLPPAAPKTTPAVTPAPGTSSALTPVTFSADQFEVSPRAWVNGKPIFDEDLYNSAHIELMHLNGTPEPQFSTRRKEILGDHLEKLIERELVLQDAQHKLGPNKRAMDKIKELAAKAFEREMRDMRKHFDNDQHFKEALRTQGLTLEMLRKDRERRFIETEYMRSRIGPLIDAVSHEEELEYYQQHLNEFQKVDRVEWQDLLIAISTPRNPTLDDARRTAQQLVARLQAGEDFKKLLSYDEGDSHYREGKGLGERRGAIQPPEVEPYLWNMTAGEIGPLVELPTGIHVFRLVKRDYSGQMPFDEKTQTQIRNKLRGEIIKRETKLILRELTSRAVIEVDRRPLR